MASESVILATGVRESSGPWEPVVLLFLKCCKGRGLKGHWRGDLSSVNFLAPAGKAREAGDSPSTKTSEVGRTELSCEGRPEFGEMRM